jgi:ATP-dependent HslUV protease subunit HslV
MSYVARRRGGGGGGGGGMLRQQLLLRQLMAGSSSATSTTARQQQLRRRRRLFVGSKAAIAMSKTTQMMKHSNGSSSKNAAAAAAAWQRRRYYQGHSQHHQVMPQSSRMGALHGTTILAVRKGGVVTLIGDGQVSLGDTVMKGNAKKVRMLSDGADGKVLAGFAGSTADCFTLLTRLEQKLEQFPGQLQRASVELAKAWRTDKYLRNLEAWLIAVDGDVSVTLTGNGDVVSEPADGVIAIGSGGSYALSAARALVDMPTLTSQQVALKSMQIAADICVYTNGNFLIHSMREGDKSSAREENLEECAAQLAAQLAAETRRVARSEHSKAVYKKKKKKKKQAMAEEEKAAH